MNQIVRMRGLSPLLTVSALCLGCSSDDGSAPEPPISSAGGGPVVDTPSMGGATAGTGGAGEDNGAGGNPPAGGASGGQSPTGGMNAGGMNAGGMSAGGMNAGGMNAGGMNAGGNAPNPTGDPICDAALRAPATFDSDQTVEWWESFVETYPRRVNQSETNLEATKYLHAQLESFGYTTRTLELQSGSGNGARTVQVVEGIRPGSVAPDMHIGLLAHYDVVPQTIGGAYDDGAGVAVQIALCELLSKVQTDKSIACLFFDAEEVGQLASGAYVREYASGPDPEVKFQQAFGFDMVGINWPGYAEWPLNTYLGFANPQLEPLVDANEAFMDHLYFNCLTDRLGLTRDGIALFNRNTRNSDEFVFMNAGIPALRFAGGKSAADYPAYHQLQDTVEFVYDFVGGKANFVAGLEMATLVALHSILAYDRFDPANLPPPQRQ